MWTCLRVNTLIKSPALVLDSSRRNAGRLTQPSITTAKFYAENCITSAQYGLSKLTREKEVLTVVHMSNDCRATNHFQTLSQANSARK